jgi:uncharacterized protein (TIGR02145 family)
VVDAQVPQGAQRLNLFGSLTDPDGNVYRTIVIGNQEWTVENWRSTKYNDGTAISHVRDSTQWSRLYTPGYCFYESTTDPAMHIKYGALYNWYAVNTGKLAPAGWQVPSTSDWWKLGKYLIRNGYNVDESKRSPRHNQIGNSLAHFKFSGEPSCEEASLSDVQASLSDVQASLSDEEFNYLFGLPQVDEVNIGNNNRSGFSAYPAGLRMDNGYYNSQGSRCRWWSSTEGNVGLLSLSSSTMVDTTGAECFGLDYNCSALVNFLNNKGSGFSVRLVRYVNNCD